MSYFLSLRFQAAKEKEEKKRQREEEIKRSEAYDKQEQLVQRIGELQARTGITFLGRDRAYRYDTQLKDVACIMYC